jgi:16S rRNA (cytosine967-C5)-methyltransferase
MLTSTTPKPPVRKLALDILCRFETTGAFVDQLIAGVTAARGLSSQARAFLRELTYGVLRWRNRLDWLLGPCADRPLDALTPEVRNLLRLGAYQLCMMDRIPPYAAVSETVRLAKQVGHGGIAAFVNAVLRSFERKRASLSLPQPDDDLSAHLTITQSHPAWLVERWLTRLGPQHTTAMCHANNALPPLVVRANRLRTTPKGLLDALSAEGCQVERCRFAPDGVLIRSHPPLDQLRCFSEGWFTVQDEAAILCGYLLDPQLGERVLDACAAPGGKATHVAELMGDKGEVVCLEQSRQRLGRVEDNSRRLRLRSLQCWVGDATTVKLDRPFDRILVDAPCSGFGVLRRHPDAKWRKGFGLIATMASQQMAMLHHVSRLLKPGGTLVYVTCSTEPEENQQIIQTFLTGHPEYQMVAAAAYLPSAARIFADAGGWFQTWPGPEDLDGFFGARLRRRA